MIKPKLPVRISANQTPAHFAFELSETCASCKFRRDDFFCQLSQAERKDFNAIAHISAYPANAVLFLEQQPSRGFFHLCQGEVKLSLSSSEGKTLILRIAGPGDVVGMWAAISGCPYEATAECLLPCQVAFISASDWRQYLRKHPAVFGRTANFLGAHYKIACEQLSAVGLGVTVFKKVAKFLLDWSAERGAPNNGSPITLSLSQEEIAEHVGATRESVTRALSTFRENGLIDRCGSTFAIPSREALAAGKQCPPLLNSGDLRPTAPATSYTKRRMRDASVHSGERRARCSASSRKGRSRLHPASHEINR